MKPDYQSLWSDPSYPVCDVLVYWLQIIIEVFNFSSQCLCFSVFHCVISLMKQRTPLRTEHLFVIWNCIRINGDVTRISKIDNSPPLFLFYRPYQGGYSVKVLFCSFVGGFIRGICFAIICYYLSFFWCLGGCAS